jgi:hypothetical protein
MIEFVGFPKIARLSRECIITEKIDGTNAQIYITEFGGFHVGSRTRWITPESDNYGFARWAYDHKDELMLLGPGRHYGEWWGSGIQRGYGLEKGDKRWSLFNTIRWCAHNQEPITHENGKAQVRVPACCHVVPVLGKSSDFDLIEVECCLGDLVAHGSMVAPGFMNPEGVVVFHVAGNVAFKKTLGGD